MSDLFSFAAGRLAILTCALAALPVVSQGASDQVPLTSKIAYGSTPSPNGGRQWVSVGWKVRLLHEANGWSCTLSSAPMVELVPNNKLRHDIPWQGQSYSYGALIRVAKDATELYAWHKGPAAPVNPSFLKVGISFKRREDLHFPVLQSHGNNGLLTMKGDVPRDELFDVIFPDMANNEMLNLRVDDTAYGLGALNFRMTLPQFQECRQWMDKYNGQSSAAK
jgi:hypothetical protein